MIFLIMKYNIILNKMDLALNFVELANMVVKSDNFKMSDDVKYYILFPFMIFGICAAVFNPWTQYQIYGVSNNYEYTFYFSLFLVLFFTILINYSMFNMVVHDFCMKEDV